MLNLNLVPEDGYLVDRSMYESRGIFYYKFNTLFYTLVKEFNSRYFKEKGFYLGNSKLPLFYFPTYALTTDNSVVEISDMEELLQLVESNIDFKQIGPTNIDKNQLTRFIETNNFYPFTMYPYIGEILTRVVEADLLSGNAFSEFVINNPVGLNDEVVLYNPFLLENNDVVDVLYQNYDIELIMEEKTDWFLKEIKRLQDTITNYIMSNTIDDYKTHTLYFRTNYIEIHIIPSVMDRWGSIVKELKRKGVYNEFAKPIGRRLWEIKSSY